jgi:acylaminoacyl-peptidase
LASVRVNYRGSTGFGEAGVRCLLGNVGTYDTKDCLLALTSLIDREGCIDKDNLLLYGGSYGGFVVAHLAGLHPQMFRAMVLRNPLIDLATKGHYADNSDG